jgi:hypothetical protein
MFKTHSSKIILSLPNLWEKKKERQCIQDSYTNTILRSNEWNDHPVFYTPMLQKREREKAKEMKQMRYKY